MSDILGWPNRCGFWIGSFNHLASGSSSWLLPGRTTSSNPWHAWITSLISLLLRKYPHGIEFLYPPVRLVRFHSPLRHTACRNWKDRVHRLRLPVPNPNFGRRSAGGDGAIRSSAVTGMIYMAGHHEPFEQSVTHAAWWLWDIDAGVRVWHSDKNMSVGFHSFCLY